ncbi:MAG TPA: penicillin-binding protein 2, partial [Myxococcales bacterium]
MTLGQNSAGRDLKVRYFYLAILMVGGLLVLGVRLFRLQITHGEEYAAKSVENFEKKIRILADRGMIRDARGEILVDNRPSFDVFATPAFCQKCSEEVLPRLATWLSWDAAQLEHSRDQMRWARQAAPFQPTLLRVDLARDELDLLNAHKLELPGVDVLRVPHRNYRTGTVMAHLLGYMNEVTQDELERLNAAGAGYALGDYIGRRGIERYFEHKLRGVDGLRKEVVNARGEPIPGLSELLGPDEEKAPRPGQNIVLSIDSRLQQAAEAAFPGVAGALVVVE